MASLRDIKDMEYVLTAIVGGHKPSDLQRTVVLANLIAQLQAAIVEFEASQRKMAMPTTSIVRLHIY